MTLKRYLIERSVESASGSQIFYIDATSEKEALKKHKAGGGDFYENNCEVTSLGAPCISGMVSLDDFGISAENDDSKKLELLIGLLRDISGSLQPGDPMKERILDTLVKVNS